jgi:hypothetical protein
MFTLDDPDSIRDSGMKPEIDTDPFAVALIHRALRECEISGCCSLGVTTQRPGVQSVESSWQARLPAQPILRVLWSESH